MPLLATKVVLRLFECGDCKFTFSWINNVSPNFCPVCSLAPVWEISRDVNASLESVLNEGVDPAA